MSGLPGSGKSTLCRWIIRQYQQRDHGNFVNNVHSVINSNYESFYDPIHNKSCHGNESQAVHLDGRVSEDVQQPIYFHDMIYLEYDQIVRECFAQMNQPKDQDDLSSSHHPSGDTDDTSILQQAWRKSRSIVLQRLHQAIQNVIVSLSKTNRMQKLSSSSDECHHVLILLDDNFHLQSMRRDVYKSCLHFLHASEVYSKLSTQYNVHLSLHFSTIYLDIPIQICIQRNAARVGYDRVPGHVIHNMACKLHRPSSPSLYHKWSSFERLFMILHEEDIHPLYNPSESSTLLSVKCKNFFHTGRTIAAIDPYSIHTFFHNEDDECQVVSQPSILHACDMSLRFLVGITCREVKTLASLANDTRKYILESIKIELSQGILQHDMDYLDTIIFQRYVSHLSTLLSSSSSGHHIHYKTTTSRDEEDSKTFISLENLFQVMKQKYENK